MERAFRGLKVTRPCPNVSTQKGCFVSLDERNLLWRKNTLLLLVLAEYEIKDPHSSVLSETFDTFIALETKFSA